MNKRAQILSWCLYDFANSSYSAVVAAVVFPVYFSREIASTSSEADLWWGLSMSISMAAVAITSPIMGGISDFSGKRKVLLIIYTLLAVLATSLLFLPQRGMVLLAFVLIVIANFGTEGGFVFYNAYLREIASPEYRGRVSGWGFGLGYLGSVLSLLVALFLIKKDLTDLVWPFVGVFFLLFALPAFYLLPSGDASHGIKSASLKGLKVAWETFREAVSNGTTRRFLVSYFIYKDAINTIIVFSSLYASTTLLFSTRELIFLYLLIQMAASAGAFVFARPTDRWGAWNVLMLSLVVWIFLSIWTYFLQDKAGFWIVALIGGLFLGVLQSASRALFCRFIPEGKAGEYFGIYALSGKSASVVGPVLFGLISSWTGSQRKGVLFVALMFILGAILMAGLRDGKVESMKQ